jgi:hypothetical protein
MVISLKEGQNNILFEIVIEGLLPNGHLDNIFGQKGIINLMLDLKLPGKELNLNIEFILEHIMWRIEVILQLLNGFLFKVQVRGEVECF